MLFVAGLASVSIAAPVANPKAYYPYRTPGELDPTLLEEAQRNGNVIEAELPTPNFNIFPGHDVNGPQKPQSDCRPPPSPKPDKPTGDQPGKEPKPDKPRHDDDKEPPTPPRPVIIKPKPKPADVKPIPKPPTSGRSLEPCPPGSKLCERPEEWWMF